ncbi:MAG: ATP-grasp domain-containing protein [Cyanobacteria bacterium J06600_6]
MELLEYQAKELFKTVGIPILPSLTIQDSRAIKQLHIPYPVVLKSQVRSGGRGKAGGVRFVANTIDAIAATRSIFNLSILGEYPEVVLAEAHYSAERELFLAIVLDYDLQRPVLLGSGWGGMNIDALLANLQQVVVEDEFSLFYARRLTVKMGLLGQLVCSVSEIIAKMYQLFWERDLDLIEINPLGVNRRGELMALDGRIIINDNALSRQPIMETFNFSAQQRASSHHRAWKMNKDFSQVRWRWLDWHDRSGQVATICTSFDSALLTWDLLQQNQIVAACSAIIENSLRSQVEDLRVYREQLQNILKELATFTGIKVIMLNIYDSEAVCRAVMETVVDHCAETTHSASTSQPELVNSATPKDVALGASDQNAIAISSAKVVAEQNQSANLASENPTQPYFVLRLLNQPHIANMTQSENIYLFDGLETSIEQIVALVKPS